MGDPSKTEKATSRRRDEFRKKGSVAKSTEVNTAVILLVAYLVLKVSGKYMYQQFSSMLRYYFENAHRIQVTEDNMMQIFINITVQSLLLTAPVIGSILIAVIIANILQFGLLVTWEPVKPSLTKINIIKGFKNLFSKKSIETLMKSLAKISVVGYIAYSTIRKDIPVIINFFNMDIQQSFFILCTIAMDVLYKIVLVFVIIAAIDYAFQRYTMEEQMKMSKQEIKEEHKRSEGDPLIKGEIRRRQQEMSRHRMMSEVPKADVVVTNPFHVAVAIRYDANSMRAPEVVAKGLRKVAEHIKEIARENDIPLVENPPVARALYKSAKVGKEIPSDLYSVVAEILTYIYKLSGKTFGI